MTNMTGFTEFSTRFTEYGTSFTEFSTRFTEYGTRFMTVLTSESTSHVSHTLVTLRPECA